ncbi:DUF1707 domain-containing protein [Nonomuraea sp. NPDC055795]
MIEERVTVEEADRDTAVRRVQEAYAQGHLTHQEMNERLHQALTAETPGELAAALPDGEERAGTIAAAGGLILRRGAWRVPRTLKVESALARVRLDLSRAVIDHPVVDIELRLGTGAAVITVPRDATVDLDGLTAGWKDPRYKARRHGTAGPTIRISGAMGLGRLTVRHARR